MSSPDSNSFFILSNPSLEPLRIILILPSSTRIISIVASPEIFCNSARIAFNLAWSTSSKLPAIANARALLGLNKSRQIETEVKENSDVDFSNHQQWNHECGWKNTLNNLRLIAQPLLLFWLIYPWIYFPQF